MAKNEKLLAKDLTGKNVYHTNNGNQTVYYDPYSKTAYIITNAKASSFSSWQLRGPICLILGAVLVLIRFNFIYSILFGIAAYIISSILFRKNFLYNQPISTNFVKPKSLGFFKDIAARYPKISLTIMCIMFASLAASMSANVIINKFEGQARTIGFLFVVVSLIFAGVFAYILHIKKKNNL